MFMALVHCVLSCANQILNCVTVTSLREQVARATVAMVTWASLLDPMKYVTVQGSCYLQSHSHIPHPCVQV